MFSAMLFVHTAGGDGGGGRVAVDVTSLITCSFQ